MPIVNVDPANWGESNVVQIDSDAPDNKNAILEIEKWAAEEGFARVNEYWLRQIFRNGQRVFRGICYRLTSEELASSQEICRRTAETAARLPQTVHPGGGNR